MKVHIAGLYGDEDNIRNWGKTYCGLWPNEEFQLTINNDDVTCKKCLKQIKEQ